IEPVTVSVDKLLDEVLAGIMPSAVAKGVSLTCHVAPALPSIEADPKRLHQILNNVLSNAVKFTPAGGTVAVDCAVRGDRIEITVRDSGVGIAPEFLPYVFDRFRQADSRPTRHHDGLGLGLAIARHLVELHHGEIRAVSDGRDKGTIVSIRIPISSAATHAVSTPPTAAY